MQKPIIILILLFCCLQSCKPLPKTHYQIKKAIGQEVIAVPIVSGTDTLISNELRFYKISSSRNSMQAMYNEFGKWDLKIAGRYQANVPQLIWQNKTISGIAKPLTISASGAETGTDYFACFVVIDEEQNDLLSPESTYRKALIDYFLNKMNNLGSRRKFDLEYKSQ